MGSICLQPQQGPHARSHLTSAPWGQLLDQLSSLSITPVFLQISLSPCNPIPVSWVFAFFLTPSRSVVARFQCQKPAGCSGSDYHTPVPVTIPRRHRHIPCQLPLEEETLTPGSPWPGSAISLLVLTLPMPLPSCLTGSKPHRLCEPQFPHQKNKDNLTYQTSACNHGARHIAAAQ